MQKGLTELEYFFDYYSRKVDETNEEIRELLDKFGSSNLEGQALIKFTRLSTERTQHNQFLSALKTIRNDVKKNVSVIEKGKRDMVQQFLSPGLVTKNA